MIPLVMHKVLVIPQFLIVLFDHDLAYNAKDVRIEVVKLVNRYL